MHSEIRLYQPVGALCSLSGALFLKAYRMRYIPVLQTYALHTPSKNHNG